MVTNFEEITKPLTADEQRLLPYLINGLANHKESDPIKEPEIVESMNVFMIGRPEFQKPGSPGKLSCKMTGARLRKMVNHIRCNGLLPVIATPKGYYVSHNPEVIQKQIQSMRDRANGILAAAAGLETLLPGT